MSYVKDDCERAEVAPRSKRQIRISRARQAAIRHALREAYELHDQHPATHSLLQRYLR
jgi:hypothetical protein